MADDSKKYPEQSQRDPSKEWNQLRPTSLRSSGAELDAGCGEIEQASGGTGLDEAVQKIDGK